MRGIGFLASCTWIILCCPSCVKSDDQPGSAGVSITFRTDSGYTYSSGPGMQGDTLLIEATIHRGDDPLDRFFLSVAFDGASPEGLDTVSVGVDPFTYPLTYITRTQPGTEEVIFTVEENDGDRTLRRLTFEVQ